MLVFFTSTSSIQSTTLWKSNPQIFYTSKPRKSRTGCSSWSIKALVLLLLSVKVYTERKQNKSGDDFSPSASPPKTCTTIGATINTHCNSNPKEISPYHHLIPTTWDLLINFTKKEERDIESPFMSHLLVQNQIRNRGSLIVAIKNTYTHLLIDPTKIKKGYPWFDFTRKINFRFKIDFILH